jgi:hypothetical protein
MFIWSIKRQDELSKIDAKRLSNKIVFNATILKIKVSGNHEFGLLLIKIDSSNVLQFSKGDLKEKFPYRIEGKKAEIYARFSTLKVGDTIQLVSNEQVFYYYSHLKTKVPVGDISLIRDWNNLRFIDNNTAFK